MVVPFTIVLPLLVAAVLVTSGIAKLRHPDDLIGWAELGVPKALRRGWLLRVHPWGELLLGVALVLLGGALGEVAGIISFALMIGYLVFVARIVLAGADASCACFGARKRIGRATVVRNTWYVLLAGGTVAVIWSNPLWGGLIAALDANGWMWIGGLLLAAVTVAVTMWPAPVDAAEAETPSPVSTFVPSEGEELDYIRSRTPAVPVTRADGELVNLRDLSMTGQPLMLLSLSPGCGSCGVVYERIARIRGMLPEVSVRVLLGELPAQSAWTEVSEPQSLHDPERYVRDSIGSASTPTAVLFGLDGLLAGGPVVGAAEILDFVNDVYESLHGERPVEPLSVR